MLDPESIEFIEWVKTYVGDKDTLSRLCAEVLEEAHDFFVNNPELIEEMLVKKITKGGEEHGTPNKYSNEDIKNELRAEYLDLLGWSLIGKKYNGV